MSNEYYKDYRSKHPEQRAQTMRSSLNRCRYGVSDEEYDALMRKQNQACAICKGKFSEESLPYVDHDHSSGWVRGLLCRDCNFAIGLLRDSVEHLQSAVEYIISTAVPTEFNFGAAKAAVRKVGKSFTSEDLQRRKDVMLGNTFREGLVPWNKGKPLSEAHKQALRKPKGTGRKFQRC